MTEPNDRTTGRDESGAQQGQGPTAPGGYGGAYQHGNGWYGGPPPAHPGPYPAPPAAGSGGWGPGWNAPLPRRRRHTVPVALGAALVVAGAAAGVGVGHQVWSTGSAQPTAADNGGGAAPGGGSNGFGSGSDGSGGFGSGSDGSGSGGFGSGNGSGGGASGGSGLGGPDGSGGGSGSGGTGTGTGGGGQTSNAQGGPADVTSIAQKISPALVDINTTFGYQNAQGAGTGIVLTGNGEILTNNHVINGATRITATDVGNGRTYVATVVGYDSSRDLAVLQLKNASGLKTATLGDSEALSVGQSVVAVGNAGGAGGTPSSAGGSITALDQSITASDELDGTSERLHDLIEVNANVQSGDSGGSLVDSSGRVVGVDTAASSQYSMQGSGSQGYAIPINTAKTVADQIEAGHSSATVHIGDTAFLGVSLASQSQGRSAATTSGAPVSGVLQNGAAAKAGLQAGAVITALDGHRVGSATALSALMVAHHPGDQVSLSWVDSAGQSHTETVTLGSGPAA